jgi:hypothetical protein
MLAQNQIYLGIPNKGEQPNGSQGVPKEIEDFGQESRRRIHIGRAERKCKNSDCDVVKSQFALGRACNSSSLA